MPILFLWARGFFWKFPSAQIRSGKTDPVQFTRGFKTGVVVLVKWASLQAAFVFSGIGHSRETITSKEGQVYLLKAPFPNFRIIIRGDTATEGYGFGCVSDMYPSPFWYVSNSHFDIEITEKDPQNVHRTVPPFRLFRKLPFKLAKRSEKECAEKFSQGTKPRSLMLMFPRPVPSCVQTSGIIPLWTLTRNALARIPGPTPATYYLKLLQHGHSLKRFIWFRFCCLFVATCSVFLKATTTLPLTRKLKWN